MKKSNFRGKGKGRVKLTPREVNRLYGNRIYRGHQGRKNWFTLNYANHCWNGLGGIKKEKRGGRDLYLRNIPGTVER